MAASDHRFLHHPAFPSARKLKCTLTYTPAATRFTRRLAVGSVSTIPGHSVPQWCRPAGDHCTESPFAQEQALPPPSRGFEPPSANITPPFSLLRAHAPDRDPPPASVSPSARGFLQAAACPCWKSALPSVTPRIFLDVLGPLPRLLWWCTRLFLPTRQRPSRQTDPVGATATPLQQLP